MPDCKCGRPFGIKPHCPRCGSSYMYATRNQDRLTEINGEKIVIRAFFCRNCAMPFDESMPCEAPLTKEAQRIKEFYGARSDIQEAQQRELAFELIKRDINKYNEGKLKSITPQKEEFYLKHTGMSFHESTGCPIEDSGPIKEDILPPEDDPDGPRLELAKLLPEDYWRLDPSDPMHAKLKAEFDALQQSKQTGSPNEHGT